MNAKSLGKIALFTAFLCVSAFISVPVWTVPITLQTLALTLCGLLLGVRASVFAVLAYLLLGAIGAPVFAGFQGGFSVFVSPTGGFLIGFLPAVLLTALGKKLRLSGLFVALSHLVLYAVGTLWFVCFFDGTAGLITCLTTLVLPFLLPDAVKAVCAVWLAKKLEKHLKATGQVRD